MDERRSFNERPVREERPVRDERPVREERPVRDERPTIEPGLFRTPQDYRQEPRQAQEPREYREQPREYREQPREYREQPREYRESREYREPRERRSGGGGGGFRGPSGGSFDNASLIKILAIVAGVLAVVLIIMLVSKAKLVSELKDEKVELTEQIEALQQDYEGLSSDYESINSQLDSSREEVNQLVERIKKTEATNRAQIRKYQKELGTLRTIMRNYIGQIDSLNQLNHKLTADAAAARRETAKVKKQNTQLQKTVDDLADKVETGSVIRGRNIKCEAYNSAGKVVDKASAAVRVLTTLSLMENNLAEKGPVRVYVVINDPNGNLITNGESRSCNYAGGSVATSASRQIDYQGSEVELSIYMNDVPSFTKGIYTVQVLTERSLLGTAQFMLR